MSTTQPQPSVEEIAGVNEKQQKNSTVVNSNGVVVDDVIVPTAAGEAQLLVTEFPPPPYYFRLAGVNGGGMLRPPPIPTDAIVRGTNQAAAIAARAREAERQQRLAELNRGENSQSMEVDKTDSILGGVVTNAINDEKDAGDVVAVFGEIIEDPLLIEPLDYCDDPIAVRNEVKRLHKIVLRTFVRMVQDLVHRPLESKMTRDELSHNIFLMLQECNKFREHQSREILIEMLEVQLAERQKLVRKLREQIASAKSALL